MGGIVARALPRVGLLGNPSDGYGGKVVAFTFSDFSARVRLAPARALTVAATGGGADLLRAAWTVLARDQGLLATDARFELGFESDIPRQVGLSGSSAIVIAALRAMVRFFGIELAPGSVAALALRAENEELGIAAGPQDRVIQAHEGLLHMDFSPGRGLDAVTPLAPSLLPSLFVAWDPQPGDSSGDVHDDLRRRFDAGERQVVAAMAELARLADDGVACLRGGDVGGLCALIDRNFDLRAGICTIRPRDRAMVGLGRTMGAAVKFCGSGGAVVGVPRDGGLAAVTRAYTDHGYRVLHPNAGATP